MLMSILSLLFIPSWRHYQQHRQADLAIQTLEQAIHAAQSFAILKQIPVSLCPSFDQHTCQQAWRDSLILFTNSQGTDQPSLDTDIHEHVPLKLQQAHLYWRHFGNNHLLTFDQHGLLNHDNGIFYYCPINTDPHVSRALVINVTGRTRLLTQRNAQGRLIGPDGKPILCP